MNPALIAVILQQIPGLLDLIKKLAAENDPNVPPPTDAEVLQAFAIAVNESLALDAEWLAAHPKAE